MSVGSRPPTHAPPDGVQKAEKCASVTRERWRMSKHDGLDGAPKDWADAYAQGVSALNVSDFIWPDNEQVHIDPQAGGDGNTEGEAKNGGGAASSDGGQGTARLADPKAWPIMESKGTPGLVGRIARLATENSEADPVAVIVTTLVYAAAEFGRAQYTRIGDTTHHSRHFGAIVGQSSRARKGTSYAPVRRIFELAEKIRMSGSTLPFPSGSKLKVSNGPLSSGEGLVYAIRDGSANEDEDDRGVEDKRLLVVEQELGAPLRAFQRSGNNLSMILRVAFDGATIEPLTK